jgi:hypothetical protein
LGFSQFSCCTATTTKTHLGWGQKIIGHRVRVDVGRAVVVVGLARLFVEQNLPCRVTLKAAHVVVDNWPFVLVLAFELVLSSKSGLLPKLSTALAARLLDFCYFHVITP